MTVGPLVAGRTDVKTSQIDRAIQNLEGEKRVLEMAIARLREQQAAKPARVRKPKPVADIAEARR